MRRTYTLLFVLIAIVTLSCSRGGKKKLTIAVIPKGTTHEFWKGIHAGSIKAARELSTPGAEVEVIWKGPLKEDDRDAEVQVVEGFIAQHVSGMVLAPLDSVALRRPVEEANHEGVPTVIIDSALASEQIVSFVATDNLKGGRLAADRIGELLNGKGKVLMLRYQEGSASTEDREKGFVEELKSKFPGIELVTGNQYAGATVDTAKGKSESLLSQYGDQVQGIFTPNESSTKGMLLALQDIGKAGKVIFVGFDASDTFIEAMRKKELHGIVVQNPFNMGYLGVRTMVEHLRGKTVEKRIDTGVTMVTLDNMNSPEMQTLLHPPIDQYLK